MNSLPTFPITLTAIIFLLLAVFAFFKLRKKAYKSEQTEGLFFESHKGPIFFNKIGNKGPTVLLVHGLGASSYCWRHTVAHLEKEFQVVTVDLWGFGNSTKTNATDMTLDHQVEILMDLMSFLKVKRFHIAGHSMGGHIALWLTHNHPDRVDKVIAIAPPSHKGIVPRGVTRLKWLAHLTPYIVRPNFIRWILRKEITDPLLITEDVIQGYYKPYMDPDTHLSFAAALEVIEDPRVFTHLDQINKQVLLLWGEKDSVINFNIIERIHSRLPNSLLKTSPRSNHLPMEDDAPWVNQQILTFLKS